MGDMKPAPFRPWAEQQFTASPVIASVEGVRDDRPGYDHITYTQVAFPSGAKIVIHWVGTDPVGGKKENPDGSPVTGPPPEPVKVPDLATSGRLRTADIEAHLVALLTNGGHEQVLDVTGYTQSPDLGSDEQPYGIQVRFHDGTTAYGLFRHMLPNGQQPGQGTEFKQRKEV